MEAFHSQHFMPPKDANSQTSANKIRAFAREQGFDLVGFSPVSPSRKAYSHYLNWLDKKFNADMSYMSRKDAVTKRKSASSLLTSAASVVCLATNYYHDQPSLSRGHGRIARYAFGRDYHKTIKTRLRTVEKFIQENFRNAKNQPAQTLSYVDTGPLLERTLAEQAGLGFIGRNSCLITEEFGSWVLLAEIVTDLEIENNTSLQKSQPPLTCKGRNVPTSQPAKSPKSKTKINPSSTPNPCGTCTRCIDACPTKAITLNPKTKTHQIDANKCIAYLTIEHKGAIPPKLKPTLKTAKRLFGCDICQEVCPHNCRAKKANDPTLKTSSKIAGNSLSLKTLTALKTDKEFLDLFAGSPLMRAKRTHLQKIAKILT